MGRKSIFFIAGLNQKVKPADIDAERGTRLVIYLSKEKEIEDDALELKCVY